MTWDGVIPEEAWKRTPPQDVILKALADKAMSRADLEAVCGGRCPLERGLAALGDRIESVIWKKVRYYRIKPDGQGPQETIKP